jgi:hypothetical protein
LLNFNCYIFIDSIIYYTNQDEFEPELGDGLGELTNELDNDGEFIVEGVFSGPKNYCYKTSTGKTKCVVKGFSLSHVSSLKLNFESLKRIVLEDREKNISVEQLKFTRDKNSWNIKTSIIEKLYRFVYDKRVLKENFETLPYGY